MPADRSTERAMDAIEEDEVLGTISTPRHEVVRYRIGHDSGDVFAAGGDYDGPTLVLEVSGTADAKAMLDAISTSAARIEALERELAEANALPRMIKAVGETIEEMRENARADPLHQHGDMVLVWANEGDINNRLFALAAHRARKETTNDR